MSVSGADSGERDVTGAHQMSLLHHHHVTTCQHIHVSWIMSCFLSADTWVNKRYDLFRIYGGLTISVCQVVTCIVMKASLQLSNNCSKWKQFTISTSCVTPSQTYKVLNIH